MDRKGKQKLKRYFIVYVIFAVFFTVGMYLITKYEENAKATQIALLLAEHPELEGEIVAIWEKSGTVDFIRDRDDQKIERVVQMLEETYGYHSGSGSSDVVIRIIWGIGLLVGVIVCSLFLYLDRRKNWSRYGDEEQLQQLYECLQEFRKGKFQTYPEETSESEQWLKVWEAVKELGQYFEDLKERLEQEENGTKSLITDISHQTRTTLSNILLYTELLEEEPLGEAAQDSVKKLRQQSEKLQFLMDALVKLSRLETGVFVLHPIRQPLTELVVDGMESYREKAAAKGLAIAFSGTKKAEEDAPVYAYFDKKWSMEALGNILDNAIKYTNTGGITIKLCSYELFACVEVTDTGIGIAEENLERIFERFYRVDKSRSKQTGGTGLGLAIVKHIVELHDAVLHLESEPGKGTTITVAF